MHALKINFFLFILLIISLYSNLLKSESSFTLRDRLIKEISSVSKDSIPLVNIYDCIIKNRKNLKDGYLPLLKLYAKTSETLNYTTGLMKSFDRIGLQYRYDAVYDSSMYYHNKSLYFALRLKDSTQLYYNYSNLGQACRLQDLNNKAINYFHKALQITESQNNLKSASKIMNSLGATYVVQKNFTKAMLYFRRSSEIALSLNDKRTLAYNYGSIGEVFLMLNQVDSAMHYFTESKALIVEMGSNIGYAVAEHLLGQAHFAAKNYDEAEKYFRIALRMHTEANNARYKAFCNTYLGKIKTFQNKPDSAEFYFTKGKGIAKSIHSLENLILINQGLHTLYSRTKQWEKAIHALKLSQNLQDSIISVANERNLQALEITYETQKKEQQIKLLSAENKLKNQRITIAIAIISALLLSIILGIYIQLSKKKQNILEQDKLKQKLMLSQMNPHFIFNVLGSIQSYMYKNDAKKAAQYMGNFASLSRAILNNSSQESISLEEEVETLRNYMELEKMRMVNAFDFEFIGIDEVEIEFIKIPPMLLQPFIENSIKHGFKHSDRKGLITISFTDNNDILKVEIIDNGVGINQARIDKTKNHKSMATSIFKQRMKIISSKHKSLPEPVIKDISTKHSGGTKVILHLPISNN